jgi:hypothetical protein
MKNRSILMNIILNKKICYYNPSEFHTPKILKYMLIKERTLNLNIKVLFNFR